MSKVQVIRDKKNKPAYAVVPWKDYIDLVGDDAAENAGLIALAEKSRGEEGLPLAVVEGMLKGENTLKLIREWRGLTQKGLAEKAGIAKMYVSQLETSHRRMGAVAAKKLAPALGISVDTLLESTRGLK
jgi:DNA-binding XRE family transcriptional regulator